MMPAGAVRMSVRYFITGSVAHLHYFNIEVQVFARQFVVAIDRNGGRTNFLYRYHHTIVGLELHAYLDWRTTERRFRHLMYILWIAYPIAFFWRNVQVEFIARLPTFKPLFHTRNQVMFAVQIIKWLTAFAGIEYLAGIVSQRVPNGGYLMFCNMHTSINAFGMGR